MKAPYHISALLIDVLELVPPPTFMNLHEKKEANKYKYDWASCLRVGILMGIKTARKIFKSF